MSLFEQVFFLKQYGPVDSLNFVSQIEAFVRFHRFQDAFKVKQYLKYKWKGVLGTPKPRNWILDKNSEIIFN